MSGNPQTVAVTAELLQATINYLQQQPYNSVAGLMKVWEEFFGNPAEQDNFEFYL